MKYYEKLVDMKCFTRQDVEKLTGNKETAKSLLNNYKKKGYIESVRRNLFVSISMETGEPLADRFVIASHIVPEACVTHHSAFQFHRDDKPGLLRTVRRDLRQQKVFRVHIQRHHLPLHTVAPRYRG